MQIPLIMPKPDVVALTGGYRSTPILQIGADIYCDTALIARVLERVAPAPSFFPQGDTLAVQAAAHFADSTLFWNHGAGRLPARPGMMKLFFKDATPEYLAAFGKDRAAMRQGGTCGAVRCRVQGEPRSTLARIEAQLRSAVPLRQPSRVGGFLALPRALAALEAGDARPMLEPLSEDLALPWSA